MKSDFYIVTMHRVAITFFELTVAKNLIQKFSLQDTSQLRLSFRNCDWLQQYHMEIESIIGFNWFQLENQVWFLAYFNWLQQHPK